jgi:hypothetical protein
MHSTKRSSRKHRRRTRNQARVQGTPDAVEVPEGRVISGYRRVVDNSANIPAEKFHVVGADSIDIGVSSQITIVTVYLIRIRIKLIKEYSITIFWYI